MKNDLPPPPFATWQVQQLTEENAEVLQQFFTQNPQYFLLSSGEVPRSDEALREINEQLPNELSCRRQYIVGYYQFNETKISAVLNLVEDFVTAGVWHIGLMIIAAHLQRKSYGSNIYQSFESWAITKGARWIRLGVLECNKNAFAFWQEQGFQVVRWRENYQISKLNHRVAVLVKPLFQQKIDEYLLKIARDRPEV